MKQNGQVLVSILIIMAVAILATGVAVVASSLSRTTGITVASDKLLYAAESGIDDALIKFLRDPSYDDETISVAGISVNIDVERPSPTELIITSEAAQDNLVRRVEVSAEFVNNILTVNSWKQIP